MKPPKLYKSTVSSPTALLLPFRVGRRWVDLHEIVRLEGTGNYTFCIFATGPALLVALTLRHLQDRIPAHAFVRLHRRHLVNRTCIAHIDPARFAADLTNGDRVAIARRRFPALRQELCA